jgi:hypothetical protein
MTAFWQECPPLWEVIYAGLLYQFMLIFHHKVNISFLTSFRLLFLPLPPSILGQFLMRYPLLFVMALFGLILRLKVISRKIVPACCQLSSLSMLVPCLFVNLLGRLCPISHHFPLAKTLALVHCPLSLSDALASPRSRCTCPRGMRGASP